MANDKKRNTGKLLDRLNTQVGDLYKSAYHSTGVNDDMASQVSDELSISIQRAIKGDANYSDLSNTTMLYSKIFEKGGNNNGMQSIMQMDGSSNGDDNLMSMFQDNQMLASLMETYTNTKWIKVLDEEIDMCLKYMPKLKTALNIKKDTVLCADSFNKSFLNISQKDQGMKSATNDKFAANSTSISTSYDLEKKVEQWYDHTSTYGETFVYVIPYKKALAELLNRKRSTTYAMRESVIFENGNFTEDYKWADYKTPKINVDSSVEVSGTNFGGSIKLSLNRTCLLSESIDAIYKSTNKLNSTMCRSIYTEMVTEAGSGEYKKVQLQKSIDDQLEYEDDNTASDGLVGAKEKKVTENQIKTPGCLVKTLNRGDVIPLYIEDICLGYYYIQTNVDNLGDTNASSVSNGYNSITSMFTDTMNNSRNESGDHVLRYISGKISENIDTNFINANQDLRKEIYMMLKYNDKFNRVNSTLDIMVTFIPPEDIVHIKFNEDPNSHRGKSDLWDGLIAAKMWIMINSTSVIGNVTRGQDKRVYYVKTMVETNVAKTLMNVVSQIKKGNFGLRQMESINNILNVVGKFNDFVIPVGPSGDSPVTFDIMQGQQFELPTELMTNLEDSAVGSIVPLEIVNSASNIDFAIRYTMTNGRLLRDTLSRQGEYSKFLSKIVTKIYNCEFNDNITALATLPPPTFLVITQGSQLIQNTTQYIDALSEVYCKDDDKALFKKSMLSKYLPSYIDLEMINRTLDEIRIEKSINASKDAIATSGEQEQ